MGYCGGSLVAREAGCEAGTPVIFFFLALKAALNQLPEWTDSYDLHWTDCHGAPSVILRLNHGLCESVTGGHNVQRKTQLLRQLSA